MKLRVGNLTSNILTADRIAPGRWYFFAATYNENPSPASAPEVTWYLGKLGATLESGTININNTNAVVGDDGPFYIGNNSGLNNAFRNPGYGRIDELAIWHRELSANEISNQFNAAYATASLSIVKVGSNAVVSWLEQGSPWGLLESAETLPGAWVFAGFPQRTNNLLVVTNAAVEKRFYRLRVP